MKKLITILLTAAMLLCVLSLPSCKSARDENTLLIAATSTPHAEILEKCKPMMEAKGYKLEIDIVNDYTTPNTAVENGDADANFFQHTPYLDDFNEKNKTHLVVVGKVHYEPYGIYAGTAKALADLKDGDKIAIPNDPTNQARALLLLEAAGLIKMPENADLTIAIKDIKENTHNYDIIEMDAALIPNVLNEVAVAVINGNYAMEAHLKVSDALQIESSDSTAAKTYANILVVKEGNENKPIVKALMEILQSKEIEDYINATYDKAVIPIH